MKNTRRLLIKGAMWIGLTRVLVNLIGFASTIVLARLLVPEDFGLVAIASSAAMIISAVSELSLAEALVQHDDPKEDHFHTAWTMNVIRGGFLASCIGLAAWPAAMLYGEPRLAGAMVGFALANLAGAFINPRLAIFERNLQFNQWIVLSGSEKLVGFVVATAIAVIFRSYWALVAGVIASQSAKVIASYALISYRPKPRLNRYRDLLSFSIWMTMGQAVQALSWRADPLILGAVLPTREVGHFNVGSRIASLAVGEVLQPIAQVLFPAFATLKHEPWRLKSAYLRAQGLMTLVALPIGFGVAAVAEYAVILLLGRTWLSAVPVIQFLAIAAALQRTSQLNPVAMATGNTKALFYRDLRAFLIRTPLVIGGLLLAPDAGFAAISGALAGLIVAAILNAFLNMKLVSRISEAGVQEQLSNVWRPLLACLTMFALVKMAGTWAPPPSGIYETAFTLAYNVLLGVCTFVAVLLASWFLSGRPRGAESELQKLVSAFFRRR